MIKKICALLFFVVFVGETGVSRGVFTQSNFTGQEGNQGPYKLTGPNGELFNSMDYFNPCYKKCPKIFEIKLF